RHLRPAAGAHADLARPAGPGCAGPNRRERLLYGGPAARRAAFRPDRRRRRPCLRGDRAGAGDARGAAARGPRLPRHQRIRLRTGHGTHERRIVIATPTAPDRHIRLADFATLAEALDFAALGP